ncbi:7033_t:CDS:1, partial [Racocetra fulgida]
FDEYWLQYDTYSDDNTCHYRKLARENNFELVGWYQINKQTIFNNMEILFDNLKKIEYTTQIPLILLYWDIECSSTRGPGYFPVGEEQQDYIYMIQIDFCFLSEPTLFKHFCLTEIPINQNLFNKKYGNNQIINI